MRHCLHTLLVVVIAFALGVGAGVFVAHRSASPASVSDTMLLTAKLAADTSVAIAYLYRMHDGKPDEVRALLEMEMDSNLVQLGERLAALPVAKRNSQQLNVIQMHRDYSAKFPHTNSVAYISDGIAKAYALLDDTAKPKP